MVTRASAQSCCDARADEVRTALTPAGCDDQRSRSHRDGYTFPPPVQAHEKNSNGRSGTYRRSAASLSASFAGFNPAAFGWRSNRSSTSTSDALSPRFR